MKKTRQIGITAAGALVALALLGGCKSDEDRALDQAKSQATSTNTPQQVQYVDGNGDTVTKTVEPPVPGQTPQVATMITPPPAGTKPHSTKPVVMPVGAMPGGAMPGGAAYPNQGAYAGNPSVPAAGPAPAPPMAAGNGYAGQPVQNGYAGQPVQGQPAQGQAGAPAAGYNLTVPAGTELAVRVNQRIDVKHAHAGERFSGEIVEPVTRDGTLLIPRGTPVQGRIDAAHRRGHFKGRSVLELRLVSMTLNGNQYGLDTHDTVRSKRGKGRRTAGFIGGMTGAGMLIGGLASGGVGLAIGGASGAGAGTLLAGATGNRDIVIPAESVVHFRLADPLVVQNQ